jgi:hypothetical protein
MADFHEIGNIEFYIIRLLPDVRNWITLLKDVIKFLNPESHFNETIAQYFYYMIMHGMDSLQ